MECTLKPYSESSSIKMRKYLVFLLLISFTFSATNISELLKVPILWYHFVEHKAKSNDVTFISFLYVHYVIESGENDANPDSQKDNKLPFKSGEHLSFPVVPSMIQFCPPTYLMSLERICIERLCNKEVSSYLSGIWQPPRLI